MISPAFFFTVNREGEILLSKIISELINLQEQADSHTAKYLKLHNVPEKWTRASAHYCKSARLRSRIQELIRKIATYQHDGIGANAGEAVSP